VKYETTIEGLDKDNHKVEGRLSRRKQGNEIRTQNQPSKELNTIKEGEITCSISTPKEITL